MPVLIRRFNEAEQVLTRVFLGQSPLGLYPSDGHIAPADNRLGIGQGTFRLPAWRVLDATAQLAPV